MVGNKIIQDEFLRCGSTGTAVILSSPRTARNHTPTNAYHAALMAEDAHPLVVGADLVGMDCGVNGASKREAHEAHPLPRGSGLERYPERVAQILHSSRKVLVVAPQTEGFITIVDLSLRITPASSLPMHCSPS